MSDRRMQSSRDDRRRDRDGPDRRRRSRSPRGGAAGGGGGRREYGDVDSYSSSRNYREREREDRYQGREERPRDRDWDRGTARRDARRDDGDRRRDNRRDRDLFDDRRGPRRDDRRDRDRDGRDGGRENPSDKARDNDDMRQMERQSRVKSASPPPRKPKEPTPDLTDVASVLTRKRRLNQWDMKPPGYENVTAEQAKLSGMFPLPGAPRQQPMDPSKLQAFMNQPGNQASSNALKPATARQSKRLFVHRLPASATDESVAEFFNLQLNGLNVTKGVDPCISAQVNQAQGYALLEFKNPEDATNAMALDGISMEPHAMDTSNGDSNGSAKGLEIRRPKDYIVPTITDDTQNEAGVLTNAVPDTQNKIGITNIPIYLNDEQMQELLQSFGELKSFVLVKDTSSEQSRGIAFCEYVDPNVTDAAVESLNGMELGDAALKVKRASIGIQQVSGEMSVNAMSLMAGTQAKADAEAGRVLCLMNMITPEELMDADESEEILDDVKEECAKYGKVLDTKMPRPTASRQAAGIGKIYVKYEEPASAQKALAALAGRKFADRTVVVTFYGEEYFDINACPLNPGNSLSEATSMPFGLGKKDKADKGDDLDSQKRSLFGGRSKSSTKTSQAAPSSANPYAAPPAQAASSNPYANAGPSDPYASAGNSNPYANAGGKSDPYAQKSQSNFSQPPTNSFGSLTINGSEAGGPPPSYSGPGQASRDKSPVPPGGYGGGASRPQNGGGYGQSGYGQGAGYGENPYGNGAASSTSRGAGGYGGLGRSNSQETMGTDAGRNALFGDAPKRVAQQQQEAPQEQSQDTSYGNAGGFSGGGFDSTEMPGGYGPGMSAQEEEDQDVQATKQQIKQYNNDSRDATRRMMAMAASMDETQASTLQTLGQQGERLYNAERHIDQSTTNAETAQKNFKSLKHAQRGMFNPGFNVSGNPFTKSKNEQQHIEREVAHLARQREIREHTNHASYTDNQRRERDQKELGRLGGPSGMPANKPSLADRAKYEFEPDDEDDAANNEIDDNLAALHRHAQGWNQRARVMGKELDSQNEQIDRTRGKTENLENEMDYLDAKMKRQLKRN